MKAGTHDVACKALGAAQVLGVHHVQLTYPEERKAQVIDFYTRALGLVQQEPASVARAHVLSFLLGGQYIDLMPRFKAVGVQDVLGHMALQVRDAQALRTQLLGQGYTALALSQVEAGLRFYAKDPAGNTLELLQPLPLVSTAPVYAAAEQALQHAFLNNAQMA